MRPVRDETRENRAAAVHSKADISYVVEVKVAVESRRDRVLPLLAQAILQAQAYARSYDARPLAVIAAREIREPLLQQIDEFAKKYAPGVAVGIVDDEGRRHFSGPGLEPLNEKPKPSQRAFVGAAQPRGDLFSDLNQWMLKVLLASRIPERLLSAPRREYRNPSELAKAAHVSPISAYRLARQLREEGFLDEKSRPLKLVRLDALLRRWRGVRLSPPNDRPMRWVLRGDSKVKLSHALAAANGEACLGLFAAADALDIGFVRGVPPHVLVRSGKSALLRSMGISPELGGRPADLFLRAPAAPQSVFRGAVARDHVLAADVLQVWLDVSAHPSRGSEQADLIWRRVLQPAFGGDLRS